MNDTEIGCFLDRPEAYDFEHLALELLRRQSTVGIIDRGEPEHGPPPQDWRSWKDVVPVPASELAHEGELPADQLLLDAAARALWKLLQPPPGTPILLLAAVPGSSPRENFGAAVLATTASQDVAHPLTRSGLDALAVRSWLAARQRGGQSVVIVSTEGLACRLAGDLERRRLRFRLPVGSRLVRLVSAAEIESDSAVELPTLLGLPPTAEHRLLNLPTLNSPIAIDFNAAREPILSAAPPWMRFWTAPRSPSMSSNLDRLAVIDLTTTRFPAIQLLELEGEDAGGRVRLHLSAGHPDGALQA